MTTIETRIDAHEAWVRSAGDEGEQLVALDLDFRQVDLDGRDLTEAQIPGGVFRGKTLDGCRSSSADLAGSDFTGAVLNEVVMVKANLDHARFDGARVVNGSWFRASTVETRLAATSFQGTTFDTWETASSASAAGT